MLLDKTYRAKTVSISMMVHQEESIWEYVYHKYAPMMYGIILKMAVDKPLAEELFKAVFLELKEKKVVTHIHPALCLKLLQHTYQSTLNLLKVRGLTPTNAHPFDGNYPLIRLFCFESTTLKETALKLAISESEMLQKLRAEFNQLRNLPTKNV